MLSCGTGRRLLSATLSQVSNRGILKSWGASGQRREPEQWGSANGSGREKPWRGLSPGLSLAQCRARRKTRGPRSSINASIARSTKKGNARSFTATSRDTLLLQPVAQARSSYLDQLQPRKSRLSAFWLKLGFSAAFSTNRIAVSPRVARQLDQPRSVNFAERRFFRRLLSLDGKVAARGRFAKSFLYLDPSL